MLLQQILNKLPPSTVTEAGLTLHGLKLEPCEDGLVLSLLPRPAPFEPGAVFMSPGAIDDVVKFLTVTAEAIRASRAKAEAEHLQDA